MAKILKNTTGSAIVINDVGRVSLPATPATYTIPPQDYDLWSASANIVSHINAGTVIVNDGYDDLKPVSGLRHIQEEGVPRPSAFIATASVIATSNSTLTLTAASRLIMMFTGTIAGQIIQLPDARTLNIGHRYEVWNSSTQSITIQNASSTALFAPASSQKTWAVLQDNTTLAGTWLFEANYQGGSGGGNGCLNFGYNGTASATRWLEVISNNPTNNTPFIVAGTKAVRSLSISTDINSTCTVTLYKNGVVLDTITLTGSKKNTKLNLNHILANQDALSAAVTSGTVSRPNFTVWL